MADGTRSETLAVGQGGDGGGRYGGKMHQAPATPEPAKLAKLQDESLSRDRYKGLESAGKKDDLSGGGGETFSARAGGTRAVKPPPPEQDTRKIIRNGDVSLEVESYDATYTKLAEMVTAEKGQIASASTQKMANGKIQATVTLRIPPERFDAVLTKLKDFGTIRNQRIGSEDVTKAYIDLEIRLKGKEILAERLRKLLAEGKGTVKELMEVEVQLGATNEAILRFLASLA